MSHLGTGWYALQVRPKSERIVARLLAGKGYEPFVPFYLQRRRWSDRIKSVELPLIPNYVFCWISDASVGPVVTTPGVIRIVGSGRMVFPVADHEVEALRRIDAFRLRAQPWPFLAEGQTVEIQAGPLRGVRGLVVRVKNEQRLVVSVTLLQRSVAVEIDTVCVVPVLGSRVA